MEVQILEERLGLVNQFQTWNHVILASLYNIESLLFTRVMHLPLIPMSQLAFPSRSIAHLVPKRFLSPYMDLLSEADKQAVLS